MLLLSFVMVVSFRSLFNSVLCYLTNNLSLSYRGPESGPGSRDPFPTESDGERDREENL